jgi:hypothetical protein
MIRRSALRNIVAIAVTAFASATAGAQAFRTYLAPTGVDTNPCTLSQPCRLLPAALAAVASGGEIWMLDSANYNTATVDVTKSVTILAVPGALGSVVTTASGAAIRVNTAGVKLALRNLVIVPLPGAGSFPGVILLNGAGVSLDGCLVANMPSPAAGVQVNTDAYLWITDSTIRGNGGPGVFVQNGAHATVTRTMITGNGGQGIFAYATVAGTGTSVDIADSTLNENGNGGMNGFVDLGVTADIAMSIKDSRIVRNNSNGLGTNSGTGAGSSLLSASNNIISNNNGAGIVVYNLGRAWASGITISTNVIGLWNTTGTLETAGNNSIRNNDTHITGTVTKIAQE